jgi:hypothetical protein
MDSGILKIQDSILVCSPHPRIPHTADNLSKQIYKRRNKIFPSFILGQFFDAKQKKGPIYGLYGLLLTRNLIKQLSCERTDRATPQQHVYHAAAIHILGIQVMRNSNGLLTIEDNFHRSTFMQE